MRFVTWQTILAAWAEQIWSSHVVDRESNVVIVSRELAVIDTKMGSSHSMPRNGVNIHSDHGRIGKGICCLETMTRSEWINIRNVILSSDGRDFRDFPFLLLGRDEDRTPLSRLFVYVTCLRSPPEKKIRMGKRLPNDETRPRIIITMGGRPAVLEDKKKFGNGGRRNRRRGKSYRPTDKLARGGGTHTTNLFDLSGFEFFS